MLQCESFRIHNTLFSYILMLELISERPQINILCVICFGKLYPASCPSTDEESPGRKRRCIPPHLPVDSYLFFKMARTKNQLRLVN